MYANASVITQYITAYTIAAVLILTSTYINKHSLFVKFVGKCAKYSSKNTC